MDTWGWENLRPWLIERRDLPVGGSNQHRTAPRVKVPLAQRRPMP